jgi:hypothetical protein
MIDWRAGPRCGDRVIDDTHGGNSDEYACILPANHPGWHLDTFRLVDEGELRLRCEIRWDRLPVAVDDL